MFQRFKNSLYNFMYGRYGNDALGNFLFFIYIALFIVNLFLSNLIIYFLGLILIFYSFFRMFSRNIVARSKENQKFLSIKNKFLQFFKIRFRRFKERKTHVYKKCPLCKAILRLPKKKGKHTCCCPKCNNSFKVKI